MNVESRIPIEILFLISQTQQILAISLRTLLVIEWARGEGGVLIFKKWFFLTGFAHFDIWINDILFTSVTLNEAF